LTTALATLSKHKTTFMVDVALLATLYFLPSFSHLTALPLYMFEPMRVAVIIAILFTNRSNAVFIAFTIPLASSFVTGHPVPFKALLMGIELSMLVAVYFYLVQLVSIPAFAALTAAIIASKVIYYTMKFGALSAGFLSGNLVSTPFETQLVLALGTAVVFGAVEKLKPGRRDPGH